MDERATKKVVIDAGHGGEDPGTIANGITAKDYTLKISKYTYDRLKDLGINASLTRDSDTTLDPNDRPKVVSNHINAGGAQADFVIMYNHS